jgi:anti-sigma factor RsiW
MTAMDCTEARTLLLSARRGQLPSDRANAVRTHLEGCAACAAADAADAELSNALARLPRRGASDDLRRRLEAQFTPRARPVARRRFPQIVAGIAFATAMAASAIFVARSGDRDGAMVAEAVNDHLRVLYSEHPVEIESGGIHQVKPWFAGKLDFAPQLAFAGDADFPLKGGSVAYFVDRKAAAFVFARRLHTITLFVFRAEGLPWPVSGADTIDGHRVYARTSRGFHTLLWQDGELGYALVSDVNEGDLRDLANRIDRAK